ncbi:MAG: hypothetical protein ACREQN_03230 [Candidatus Binataceae bacterium]
MNFIGRGGAQFPEIIARYKKIWEEHRKDPGRINPHVADPIIGSLRHIVVADTDQEADAIARVSWPVYQNNFAKRGIDGPGPETRPDGSVVPIPNGGPATRLARDYEWAKKAEIVLVGSPDTIGKYVKKYPADANYFMTSFHWGSLTHDQAMHSLELFGTEIIPRSIQPRQVAAAANERREDRSS